MKPPPPAIRTFLPVTRGVALMVMLLVGLLMPASVHCVRREVGKCQNGTGWGVIIMSIIRSFKLLLQLQPADGLGAFE